jgi:hypothetical protein
MPLSPEGLTRERLLWWVPATTKNYRPDFSSERAPHNQQTRNCLIIIEGRRIKIGRWSQLGAWHQERRADFDFDLRLLKFTGTDIQAGPSQGLSKGIKIFLSTH